MSRLALGQRPWVAFDATNRQHRRYYADYVRTGTWGRCPVRFVVPDDFGDLITMIQRALIVYYIDKEFKVAPGTVERG